MPLYNSALAPAVPKSDDGTTVASLGAQTVDLSAWDGATSPTAAEASAIGDAIDAIQEKLDDLIEHLNNGRVKPF